ncbi:MAG: pyruvate formate lyase family protein, partial [Intestinibaculum porci]|uniref:pyruvate formate lyase family protein n=1 Tax=Intestinibaculum porci TaxID=2487118 RepID=UPI00240A015E
MMQTPRIQHLKARMFEEKRYASIEQARIITKVYQAHESDSIPKKRALVLKASLEEIAIGFDREELIVGNRTKGVRAGVVFPESGSAWVNREFETLPSRPQDRFAIREEDIQEFREKIYPYWHHRSLEDAIYGSYGDEIASIAKVVKINQKDHAQGHI